MKHCYTTSSLIVIFKYTTKDKHSTGILNCKLHESTWTDNVEKLWKTCILRNSEWQKKKKKDRVKKKMKVRVSVSIVTQSQVIDRHLHDFVTISQIHLVYWKLNSNNEKFNVFQIDYQWRMKQENEAGNKLFEYYMCHHWNIHCKYTCMKMLNMFVSLKWEAK